MWGKLLTAVGTFLLKRVITASNIKKLLITLVGMAEKHVKSSKNDLDDKVLTELKKALGM